MRERLVYVNERSKIISRLLEDAELRADYLRAKLNVNVPSQVKALRRRQNMTQDGLADAAGMKQSRISAIERPGETAFNLETLIRLAAAFKVGVIVKFAPFSDVLRWENDFSQDDFDVTTLDHDGEFLLGRRSISGEDRGIATGMTLRLVSSNGVPEPQQTFAFSRPELVAITNQVADRWEDRSVGEDLALQR